MSKILETTEKEQENNINRIELQEESRKAFRRAMKIAYYMEFNKKGLITDDELEQLIALQNTDASEEKSA